MNKNIENNIKVKGDYSNEIFYNQDNFNNKPTSPQMTSRFDNKNHSKDISENDNKNNFNINIESYKKEYKKKNLTETFNDSDYNTDSKNRTIMTFKNQKSNDELRNIQPSKFQSIDNNAKKDEHNFKITESSSKHDEFKVKNKKTDKLGFKSTNIFKEMNEFDFNEDFNELKKLNEKQTLVWSSGTSTLINDINYPKTSCCPKAILKENFKIDVRVDSFSAQISLGLSDRSINENKSLLGLNFDKGNIGLLSSGYIAENGIISKKRILQKIDNGDTVSLIVKNGYLKIELNSITIDFETKLNYKEYYFGASLEALGDKISIVGFT